MNSLREVTKTCGLKRRAAKAVAENDARCAPTEAFRTPNTRI